MTLQIYLSSGTVPVEATEPTEEVSSTYPWGGFGIPIFNYGTINDKAIYIRHITHDNPEELDEELWTYTYDTFYVHSVTLTSTIEPFYEYDVTTQYYRNTGEYSGWGNIAGIVDGTQYDYFQVFDQSQVSYLPYESAYDTPYTENAPFPNVPYDPDGDPPSYPVDTASAVMPDGRSSVNVNYTLTVVWSLTSMEDPSPTTTTFDIAETCTQSGDMGSAVRTVLSQSSYVAGYRPFKNPDNDPWTWADEEINVSFD